MSFLIAVIITAIGIIPMLLARKGVAAIITLIVGTLLNWLIIWGALPSFVWPLFGAYGIIVTVLWIIGAIVASIDDDKASWVILFPVVAICAFIFVGFSGSGLFRSGDYARLIGQVEEREWTQDIQPKSPEHIRMVTKELAGWLADKQIGNAPNAIGSQFHVAKDYMTLQMVKGELWYVAPLEFNGFTEWTNADVSPGFVMVDAEDPYYPVQIDLNHQFKYMTEACFGDNLKRHLRNNGFWWKGITDYSFEVDDSLHAFWVVTVFKPTIAYSGEVVTGVVTVNPETGEVKEYPLGSIPHWIDRAVPQSFILSYVDNMGKYTDGWLNSWWGKKNLIEGETPTINYGSDNEPYWVTTLTSTSSHDESMVGLIYTNSRTGKSIRYKAKGGTEAGVLQAVDNVIQYKRWHGSDPVLYNIYGTMASIAPLLGESHTFQGVAIVEVDKMLVAVGADQYEALREYQKLLTMSGHQIAADLAHKNERIIGIVARFGSEVHSQETHYYLFLKDGDRLFTGVSELSPKLPITNVGDNVAIEFIDANESVVPMMAFDNLSVSVIVSEAQSRVNETNLEKRQQVEQKRANETARGTVNNMSDEELQKLLEDKNNK